ncbi:hypothetical protein XENOCAPTIV_019677 [Xenoophorus captivus]|uniref:Uncharacterized protein n=1 Tax=Xenoophorus captivus TaxID=1517983 RepID=A0ABV0SHE4_9TELE
MSCMVPSRTGRPVGKLDLILSDLVKLLSDQLVCLQLRQQPIRNQSLRYLQSGGLECFFLDMEIFPGSEQLFEQQEHSLCGKPKESQQEVEKNLHSAGTRTWLVFLTDSDKFHQ